MINEWTAGVSASYRRQFPDRVARRLGVGESRGSRVARPIIAGLARCTREDIDTAWRALKDAERPRIHVLLATSAIHREHKLNMAKDQILRTAVEGVMFARSLCADVEFSPEDASRTGLEFLAEVVEAAIDAGATTINVPDTVGYTVPEESILGRVSDAYVRNSSERAARRAVVV
jgi:isopropylmalate/homocitrate/citramalate synthase